MRFDKCFVLHTLEFTPPPPDPPKKPVFGPSGSEVGQSGQFPDFSADPFARLMNRTNGPGELKVAILDRGHACDALAK